MNRPSHVHRQAAYALVVDGRSIEGEIRPRLLSLSLTEKRGTDADELEIVLSDHDGQLAIPPAGATITLRLGWRDLIDGAAPVLFDKGTFKVAERSHSGTPDQLTIRARSADLGRPFRARRVETWSETTLGAVLRDIAARNGLTAAVSDDMAAIEITHLNQARESDAALLSRLGRLHDAVATVKAERLVFAAIGSDQTPSGETIPPARLTRRDGDRHRWKAAERESYSGVTAEWHDRSTGQRRTVTAGAEDNAQRLGRTFATEAAAQRAAEAQRKRQDRKGAEFGLDLAAGRPDLYPGRRLQVEGFKPEINAADWLIVQSRHQLDGSGGLRTTLDMELGGRPANN